MWHQVLTKIINFLDRFLDKYREPKTHPQKANKEKYTPQTLEDFIDTLRRTPKSVLSTKDRNRIAAIMSFDDRTIGQLMISKDKMIFVHPKDVLGPLTLDKLYKSGFTRFPVIDHKNNIKGILHTEALNTLEIKKTDRAEKYINKSINYLHTTDSLQFAIDEMQRLGSNYFLVLDDQDSLVGFFTTQTLLDYLLK